MALLFVLFLILIIAAAGAYYYLAQKLDNQRKQILVLSKQNDVLRSKVAKNQIGPSDISIKYSIPTVNKGTTKANCELYIAPLDNSPVIVKLSRPIVVTLLCRAELFNQIWYEVSVDTSSPINSRGWIKSTYLTFSNLPSANSNTGDN